MEIILVKIYQGSNTYLMSLIGKLPVIKYLKEKPVIVEHGESYPRTLI